MEVVSSMPTTYWETRGNLWHLTWFYRRIFFLPSRFSVLTLQKLSIKLVFGCFLHLSLHEILTSDIANSTVAGCLSHKTSLVQCGGFNSRWRHRFSFASRFMNLAYIMTKLATVTEWLKRSTCRGFKLHFSRNYDPIAHGKRLNHPVNALLFTKGSVVSQSQKPSLHLE